MPDHASFVAAPTRSMTVRDPVCGMALEPAAPSLDDAPNPELVDFTRRLWVAGALGVPLLVLSMGGEMLGVHLLALQASAWMQLALTAPIVLWAGWPFFERGWASIVCRNLSVFTLIAIGVGAAFLYSPVGTVAPGVYPFNGMLLLPMFAGAAMALSSLTVVRNALRLGRVRL